MARALIQYVPEMVLERTLLAGAAQLLFVIRGSVDKTHVVKILDWQSVQVSHCVQFLN
jgi:hypothetical protein